MGYYDYSSSGTSAVTIYIVLGVIVGIIYFFSTAFFTGWLAGKKGYSSGLWGTLGFFFGFVALLTIGFAPNMNISKKSNNNVLGKNESKNNDSKLNQTEYRGENDISNNNNWICGKCGTVNELYLPCCKKCNKEFTG